MNSPTVTRYSVTYEAPILTDALILGDLIHSAIIELSDGLSVFTGCDPHGKPLKGHSHAFILSESNMALGRGLDGEITNVTIFASSGFQPSDVSALEDLKEIQGSGLNVRLSLLGLGIVTDFGGLKMARGQRLQMILQL